MSIFQGIAFRSDMVYAAATSSSVQLLNSTTKATTHFTDTSEGSNTTPMGRLSENYTTQVAVQATPTSQDIVAGEYARFDININQTGTANVLLVARGLPYHSNAIFAPQKGVADPQFQSTLAIVTSTDTPAGNYNITVVALLNGEEYTADISLHLASNTAITQTRTAGLSTSLSIGVETDLSSYQPNATIEVRGHVTDGSGGAIAGAGVSVQVDDPTGAQLFYAGNLTTDDAGIFHTSVKLGATSGTYAVFVSSSKSGYSATTHTTFVVGSSMTPSIVISQVYVTDTTGSPSGVFSSGETAIVWVVVQNNGAPLQGIIWVQILDPNGTPQSIQLQISTLGTGSSIKVGFGFSASTSMPHGIYTANALVSDKLISQGGVFLASARTQFDLTG